MRARIILDADSWISGVAERKLDLAIGGRGYSFKTGDAIEEDELKDTEVLLFRNAAKWLSKEMLAKMPNLRLIQAFSAGVDHIKFEDIREEIKVCGNVGAYSDPIAEHVFALILAFAKDLFAHQRDLSNDHFIRHENHLFLKGKYITILGTGGIGQAVARIANCFQMKTYGVNSTGINVANFQQITTLSNVDEFLPLSDVVVVALPLTVKTRGLIDRDKLNRMKEDSILINVARAAIVDERDLFEHLTNHQKFRAAFDVWWRKWPKSTEEKFTQNYPFFQLPNFIGTPHTSGGVPESQDIAPVFAVENIIRYVESRELRGLVDRRDYFGL